MKKTSVFKFSWRNLILLPICSLIHNLRICLNDPKGYGTKKYIFENVSEIISCNPKDAQMSFHDFWLASSLCVG